MKNKAFTLIEVLLSLMLVVLFLGTSVICTESLASKQINIETKVSDYVSLSKFVKCQAELNGKQAKMLVISNKIEALIENAEGEYKNISSLQEKVDNINEDAIFGTKSTNGITYLPDGELETYGPVSISVDDTNIALVNINDFDYAEVVYTNKIEDLDAEK